MKELSIQTLDSDCSVCMTAICYIGLISAVPTNEQLDSLKTEGLVRVYTDERTDMAKSNQPIF